MKIRPSTQPQGVGMGDIVPAAASGVAIYGNADVVDSLVGEDLVVQRTAGIQVTSQSPLPFSWPG